MRFPLGVHDAAVLPSRRAWAGFTLMEMLLALLVAGILVAMATASYSRQLQTAKIASAAGDLGKIKLLIDRYRVNNNDAIPLSLADINADGIRDPWGNPYAYLNFSTVSGNGQKRKDHNLVPINSDFDLYSKGADGQTVGPLTAPQSRDDVIVANNGQYIGLASKY